MPKNGVWRDGSVVRKSLAEDLSSVLSNQVSWQLAAIHNSGPGDVIPSSDFAWTYTQAKTLVSNVLLFILATILQK